MRNGVRVEMSSTTVTAPLFTTSQPVSTSVAETTGTTAKPVNITGKQCLRLNGGPKRAFSIHRVK